MQADDLRVLLIESGRTQRWLASKLGVAENTVSGWSTGRMPIPDSRDDSIRGLLDQVCPVCGADLRTVHA
jgi:DNA-binding transcriptional regulator YdaS (Cro superfamily)